MSRKRISKKELKEDAFVSGAFEASHYIQEHTSKIIGGIIGVLVLSGLAWMYVNFRAETRSEAALTMFKAEGLFISNQFSLAAVDFENVADDYSGTEQGRKAVYFAADSYYNSGDYDRALELFNRYMDENGGDDPLLINCLVGIAACHEQFEEYPQALENYHRALELAEYDFQRVEILSSISRTHRQAGQAEQAIAMLDEIIESFPDDPRNGEFIEIRAELKAGLAAGTGS
ncbi:MAG: tetratricopeptide repeat protein [Candidatus Glassbacteria bacterium]|nr:tetratricopeptide repeat protein [Candidatus Glassbacteria bacterium]